MKIISAQYTRNIQDTENENIKATIDGIEMFVPINPDNRHYLEIMKQVEAGTLTIEDAD
tara:strand:+ start:532 stop:708 length:177 start_codon:yes stop_codon:yes gene_type:complete